MGQTTLPRYSHPFGGVDYGGKRRLIAATPDKRVMLFIVEGYSAARGVRGFGREYHSARLALITPTDLLSTTLSEGRISKATLVRHREVIDEAFGAHVTLDLDPRKTHWVTPQGLVELT